jgi:exopolyphosphatase/guanosine-5'-triphosphate,3'-diphosphate pyrophosphatase
MANKLAIIDIGSNSIRYAEERAGALPEKEIFTTRLGSGLMSTGRLADATVEKSLDVLISLGERARQAGLDPRAYATSAVRDAANGREFAALIEEKCGIPVEILTGEQEARYAFNGAMGARGACAMLDIGGASMQVVTRETCVSFRAGCVRCGDIARAAVKAPDCDTLPNFQRYAVERYMEREVRLPEIEMRGLVGVGGTITTLAAIEAGLSVFSREAVERVELTSGGVEKLIERLMKMGDKRRGHPMLKERHDVILYGAYVLSFAMKKLGAERMSISCSDGMEGYLYKLKHSDDE